jgi:hypothetical protein
MAKLNSTTLVITVSQLTPDSAESQTLLSSTQLEEISQVVQQVAAGQDQYPVLVEIQQP